jgi:hypothetical protein
VTAINAAAAPSLPVASANSTTNLHPVFPFSKFFSGNEPDSPTPPKKRGDDETNTAAGAFIPAPLKLLHPISLKMAAAVAAAPAAPEEPADTRVEKLDLPQTQNAESPDPGEFAFAAKLVDDLPRQTPAQPVSKSASTLPAPQQTQQPTPSTAQHSNATRPTEPALVTERHAGTVQRRADASPPAEAPLSAPAQHEAVAVQPHTTTPNPMLRDLSSSSSLTSRAIESTPVVQASEPVARIPTAVEHAHSSSPLQDISIRVAGPEQSSASIRLVESGSEIRVAVRASDPHVADSLRANVEQLTSRLNNNGMSAEVWKPSAVPAATRAQSPAQDMSQEHRGSTAQQWRGSTNRDRQNDKQNRPEWAEEYELWT